MIANFTAKNFKEIKVVDGLMSIVFKDGFPHSLVIDLDTIETIGFDIKNPEVSEECSKKKK